MDPFSIGDPSVNIAPLFVRLTHWFNVLFLTLLVRSGLAILAAHPKLYWNIHSQPGSEWLRFTRKKMPEDRIWCSTDEEEEWPGLIALPGGDGLVDHPMELSLEELRRLPRQEYTSIHQCIHCWASIGRWGGVRVSDVLARCGIRPEARYLAFHSFGKHENTGKPCYECVTLDLANHPQALLAYELNGEPLPVQHGAPVRLRLETKLGFKMVKYLRSIEVIDDYSKFGGGQGGVREDEQQFDMGAEI
ncbi:MAG: molybdopterin-dependent oxidoreductase [Isosphaeraceae bacterium]